MTNYTTNGQDKPHHTRAASLPSLPQSQAQAALTAAQNAETFAHQQGGRFNYAAGFRALRDAQVGSGLAVLALGEEQAAAHAELAVGLDRLTAAVDRLTEAVTAAAAPLPDAAAGLREQLAEMQTDLGDELSELSTEVAEAGASATSELGDIAGALAVLVDRLDRPRWWQWRRRNALKRAVDQVPAAVNGEEELLV
ncbi:hypothetical protein [Actinomadura rudentiformis]|uniref:Uncharacterized protein n=1 Tax=Actinomadura rudentiformis TaxID=359158 RepID=A0A6H9Z8S5_9ACTN|nr:hypothetical protein [Actinomadura rudentiformis]KAB2351606.1 hypothetical protein F8566_05115 [Actinomadura rudentiformis]